MAPTLVKPLPVDPAKAPIENALEVIELPVLGPNIFSNARETWLPPGARGIYGGTVIAMSLASAQRTVPDTFLPHSCHCYFLLAGNSDLPLLFHVELVRDGRSFATRTVQARQKGRCIFTTTVSFVRDVPSSSDVAEVRHASSMPRRRKADGSSELITPPPDDQVDETDLHKTNPFQVRPIEITPPRNEQGVEPGARTTRQWYRARGTIKGGAPAHLEALAYISDSYFIGTITRIHKLWRFSFPVEEIDKVSPRTAGRARALHKFEGGGGGRGDDDDGSLSSFRGRPEIGMMVSLDHTIYFHEPKRVRADEWMFAEMSSPWAGDGRGVVSQKIYAKDGTLLATCMQEGVVRLKQKQKKGDEKVEASSSKSKL